MNSEFKLKSFVESVTTNGLAIFTSISTVAFGADRLFNHDLWIGGSLFVFMGLASFAIIIARVIVTTKEK